MDEKNTKYLLKKYPNLYKQYYLPMTTTCMCWGFECSNGWFKLIDELSKKIVKINKNVEAVQVKEKFGGLRFYVDFGDKKIWKLIEEYEKKSYKTCEYCGKKGKLRNLHGWYSTQCDKCLKKENENKNK